MGLRIHPRVEAVDEDEARRVLRDVLERSDNGALAAGVWAAKGGVRVERAEPLVTAAGKTLSFDRLRSGVTRL